MSGNRTPGVCVTGRNVTNYTNTDNSPNEVRTHDLTLTKRILCQLSYKGNVEESGPADVRCVAVHVKF